MPDCMNCSTYLGETDAWCLECVESIGAQVKERDAKVAQLTQERDAFRGLMDGIAKAYRFVTESGGTWATCRHHIEPLIQHIEILQEGQGDASRAADA